MTRSMTKANKRKLEPRETRCPLVNRIHCFSQHMRKESSGLWIGQEAIIKGRIMISQKRALKEVREGLEAQGSQVEEAEDSHLVVDSEVQEEVAPSKEGAAEEETALEVDLEVASEVTEVALEVVLEETEVVLEEVSEAIEVVAEEASEEILKEEAARNGKRETISTMKSKEETFENACHYLQPN